MEQVLYPHGELTPAYTWSAAILQNNFFQSTYLSGCSCNRGTDLGRLYNFNPSYATTKKHLKMFSAEVVCCILMLTSMTYFGIQANSVPLGAV